MKTDSFNARTSSGLGRSGCFCFEIGTILRALPECFRGEGRMVEIKNAYALGCVSELWTLQDAAVILFLANMESAQSSGHGNRALRRARALGLVSTEFGVGRFNERGELEKVFGVHVSPAPKYVVPATIDEIADFYKGRRELTEELGAHYERKTFTGD
jgi:hypothetical protein